MHQTKELWFLQILMELRKALELLDEGAIDKVNALLVRIGRIFEVMTASWPVLATLSKVEFHKFRGPFMDSGASGVQSLQFRQLEFLLGIRERGADGLNRQTDPDLRARLEADLQSPSIWDKTNHALAKAGFRIADRVLKRRWAEPYQPDRSVTREWRRISQDPNKHRSIYRLGQGFIAVAHALGIWRAKHIQTVRGFIGDGPGSGGTDGVPYLRDTLVLHPFPELWALRTEFEDRPRKRSKPPAVRLASPDA